MKITHKLLTLVLAAAMLLSLGSAAFAADSDWADYQQYVIGFAVAGAPEPADAVSMTEIINGCSTMDELLAAEELGVFFNVIGVLKYDDWVAAGKPAEGAAASGSSSGEASGEASDEIVYIETQDASGEPVYIYGDLVSEAGDNAVVSYHEDSVVYVSDGVEHTEAIGEGQSAFLTVGGVNVAMRPGNYSDTVVVDIVDAIFESDQYQKSDKDVNLSTELASVLYITEDGLQENQSVMGAIAGGEITEAAAASGEPAKYEVSGLVIRSEDVDALSGIRAGGSAVVEVTGADIELSGEGGNDFMGQGAAFCATDGSTLIVRDSKATVSGWVRGVTFAGGQARLECYDSEFICDAGEYDENGSVSGAGMSQPPKGLGVWGNTRLNNMVHNADEYFENCVFTSRNWGCLGVDAVEEGTLTCVGCEINILESGYGAYSIGACVDTFSDCVFNIHNGVVAFVAVNGTVILNEGTVANSDRYGIVTHQAMNMVSNVKVLGEGTTINSAYTSIMVKGRSADIEVGDGAALNSYDSGVIIQAQDNDDTGAGTVNTDAVVNVDIHDTALSGDIVMSMAPAAGSTSTMAVVLDNASVDGAITLAESELAIPDGNITLDNILDVGMVTNTYAMRADCGLTVELKNGAVWNVTEASYVSKLTVDATSAVNGTITETADGCIVAPAAAAAVTGDVPATDGSENQANVLSGTAQPATEAEYEAYEAYLRDYMTSYAGVGDGTFDDGARAMALGELDSVGFGADVNAFPFEMYVTVFGAMDYAAFAAK